MVHGGKIYETDGSQPVAVHEAADVRPLPPVGHAPSIRFFRFDVGLKTAENEPVEVLNGPLYSYGNPASIIGASQVLPMPEFTRQLDYEPYLAAVVGQAGHNVPIEEADAYVLGYSILNAFVARDAESAEARACLAPGRSRDFALALGPVLTTPDELDETAVDHSAGARYKLSVVARVNGVERRRGDALDLRYTFAQALSAASVSAVIRPGEVIALGPVTSREATATLGSGDEVQVAVEKLGTLATRIE